MSHVFQYGKKSSNPQRWTIALFHVLVKVSVKIRSRSKFDHLSHRLIYITKIMFLYYITSVRLLTIGVDNFSNAQKGQSKSTVPAIIVRLDCGRLGSYVDLDCNIQSVHNSRINKSLAA